MTSCARMRGDTRSTTASTCQIVGRVAAGRYKGSKCCATSSADGTMLSTVGLKLAPATCKNWCSGCSRFTSAGTVPHCPLTHATQPHDAPGSQLSRLLLGTLAIASSGTWESAAPDQEWFHWRAHASPLPGLWARLPEGPAFTRGPQLAPKRRGSTLQISDRWGASES